MSLCHPHVKLLIAITIRVFQKYNTTHLMCFSLSARLLVTVLPLYLGENVLGRDPSACSLPLHAQSVSKQHTAISISVFRGGARRDVAAIEALVWDMGSMNGTRKGRLKLAPHVRYALSEGDKLIVADIPCQFTSCGDTGSLVNRDSLVARESQGTREDGEVHENGNAEEPARASLGERGAMMETPARTKGLSFEQTPTQPEGSLVPESDSDSDGERGKKGQWRKTLGMWRRKCMSKKSHENNTVYCAALFNYTSLPWVWPSLRCK